MKFNYDEILMNYDGLPFRDERGEMTLKSAIGTVCAVPVPGDDALSMVDKFRIGEIGATIYRGLDISAEQVALVKERSAKVFNSPAMVFALHEALESPMPQEDETAKTYTKKR